ncbi:MAG: transcriptional regulator MraZ [Clostridia bacterium]|nr:transcriptional regulator MraZ [Clostridia bacterium]
MFKSLPLIRGLLFFSLAGKFIPMENRSGIKWSVVAPSGRKVGDRPMFMGEYLHTIDNKGRFIIPAKFRDQLGESFVITKGMDNCLFVYPMNVWVEIEQKLRSLPFTRADARAFVRFFFSGATECELDRQGRVLLPVNLREYAKLEKEIVVVGVSNRIEIWSRKLWDEYCQKTAEQYEELAEKIVDFDI